MADPWEQTSGILASAMNAGPASSQTIKPMNPNDFGAVTDSKVTDDELVEKRIQNLMSQGNPLLQQAQDDTMRAFAARGLQNSSIAAQAAREAMLKEARAIATADAGTYTDTRFKNQDASNTFAGQGTKAGYDSQLMGQEYGFRGLEAEADRTFRQSESALDRENQLQISRNSLAASQASANASMSNASLQREFEASQNALDRDWRAQQSALDRETRLSENQFSNDQRLFENYSTNANYIRNDFDNTVLQINNNTNMKYEDKQRALYEAETTFRTNMDRLNVSYTARQGFQSAWQQLPGEARYTVPDTPAPVAPTPDPRDVYVDSGD